MSDQASGPTTASLSAWRVLSTETVLDSPWLKVRADRCVTAEGHEVSPYYVLEYPDWALVIATDTEGQLILVKQYRHGAGVISTELPCGGIDKSDADPIAAGQRELLEETGYGGGQWTYLGRLAANPATQTNYCHIVLAAGVGKIAEPVEDAAEKLVVIRTPVEAAIHLALSSGMHQAMHVAALMIARDKLAAGS